MNIVPKSASFACAFAFACATPSPATAPAAPTTPATPAIAAPAPSLDDPAAILSRFKQATGGAAWDAVVGVRSEGTLSAAGLTGPVTTIDDERTGRSITHYTLGPVSGATGFDGATSWEQDPGGEVRALDTPDAGELTRTDAWMTAIAFWYPDRGAASYGAVEHRDVNNRRFDIVTATPTGGRAIAMWFDAATGLLARTVERRGANVTTTLDGDYRAVADVKLPFAHVIDETDPAGRTDPRTHVEIHLDRATLVHDLDASAFAMPAMAATARITAPSGVTHVPFELVNNHIYAAATVDGKPVHVIVDTGGANVLTPAVAGRLVLASQGTMAGQGVGSNLVDVGVARAGEVRLGDAVLDKPIFYVMDLGALPAMEGVAVDGLVGFEMFRRFRVSIDYTAHVLTLTDPARFTPPAGAHVIPFEMADRIPIIAATLDGLPVRLSVDTGSRSSLSMHSPFVRDHDLVGRYHAGPDAVLGWGVGGASRARPARFGTLQLGDLAVEGIAGDLFTGDKGAFANPDISGNLGAGVLRRFTVTFDYDARKMYLIPNRAFAAPDAFDRSGLWLELDGDALEAAAVTADGPAAKAGIAEGDRLVRIGGEPIAARTLADWRVRLRELPAGTKLEVAVEHAGAKRTVHVVLADQIPPHAVAAP